MHFFKDNTGREWAVAVNVETIERTERLIGVKLPDVARGQTSKLLADPALLVNVLWCLVLPQAEKRGVSDVEFGQSLGDQIEHATQALLDELADSYGKRERRLIRKALDKNFGPTERQAARLIDQSASISIL